MKKLRELRAEARHKFTSLNDFELVQIIQPDEAWVAVYGEDVDDYFWTRKARPVEFLGLAKWTEVIIGIPTVREPCETCLVGVVRLDGLFGVAEGSTSCFGVTKRGRKISKVDDWRCPLRFPADRELDKSELAEYRGKKAKNRKG
jgi:hypothetical protein